MWFLTSSRRRCWPLVEILSAEWVDGAVLLKEINFDHYVRCEPAPDGVFARGAESSPGGKGSPCLFAETLGITGDRPGFGVASLAVPVPVRRV